MSQMFKSMLYRTCCTYLHMPQFSTVQGVCKSAFLFVLLLHAYSYASYTVDREIFMLRITPIEIFFHGVKFFDLRNF